MEISIKMTQKDLFIYSMYNSNSGWKGIFNLLWTIGWLGVLISTWNSGNPELQEKAVMVFCILLFSLIQPCVLWNKSKNQSKTAGFSTPVNLTLSEDQIHVEQGGNTGDLEWAKIRKVIRIKPMFIIDMGFGRAYLVPNESIRGREQEFVDVCKKALPKTKTKGLKA